MLSFIVCLVMFFGIVSTACSAIFYKVDPLSYAILEVVKHREGGK